MKLPTDNVVMSPEEQENFFMLFPDEKTFEKPNHPIDVVAECPPKPTQKLKKEVLSLSLFIFVFFILNLPQVKNLIVEYIPLCNKSWIATHLVQAVLFAFILWIVINSEYSRV